LIPRPPGERSGIGHQRVQQALCRRRRPDGILTVTGTTTVSDVVKPSTNQLIDLGGPTNQWRSFYAQDATLSDGLTVDGGSR
jgi:hypothetical protein